MYSDACLCETLRKFPVGPFGMPHATNKDIELKGFLIPEGTTLMPNVYAVSVIPFLCCYFSYRFFFQV